MFWLSQVYYLMGEYSRAINLLRQQKLLESSVACRYLAIQCMVSLDEVAVAYLQRSIGFFIRGLTFVISCSNELDSH